VGGSNQFFSQAKNRGAAPAEQCSGQSPWSGGQSPPEAESIFSLSEVQIRRKFAHVC